VPEWKQLSVCVVTRSECRTGIFFKAIHISVAGYSRRDFQVPQKFWFNRVCKPLNALSLCVYTGIFRLSPPWKLEQTRKTVAIATKINARSIVISVHGISCERSDIISIRICNISTLLAAQRRTARWEFPTEISRQTGWTGWHECKSHDAH